MSTRQVGTRMTGNWRQVDGLYAYRPTHTNGCDESCTGTVTLPFLGDGNTCSCSCHYRLEG